MNRLHELWQELRKERLWLGALLCFAMGLVLGARAGWTLHTPDPGRYAAYGTNAVLDTATGQLCEPAIVQPGTYLPVCGGSR